MKVPALMLPLACFRLNCAQATGRKGEEPASNQHLSPPNLAQLMQAAGTGSLAPRLFQHSLLTLLIPLCVLLPGSLCPCQGMAQSLLIAPASCHVSPSLGLLFSGVILGTAGPCLAAWDRMVTGSIPCPFPFTTAC